MEYEVKSMYGVDLDTVLELCYRHKKMKDTPLEKEYQRAYEIACAEDDVLTQKKLLSEAEERLEKALEYQSLKV